VEDVRNEVRCIMLIKLVLVTQLPQLNNAAKVYSKDVVVI